MQGSTLSADTWYHLAFSLDSTFVMRLYIDGACLATIWLSSFSLEYWNLISLIILYVGALDSMGTGVAYTGTTTLMFHAVAMLRCA